MSKYSMIAVLILGIGFAAPTAADADTLQGELVKITVHPASYAQHSTVVVRRADNTYASLWIFRKDLWWFEGVGDAHADRVLNLISGSNSQVRFGSVTLASSSVQAYDFRSYSWAQAVR